MDARCPCPALCAPSPSWTRRPRRSTCSLSSKLFRHLFAQHGLQAVVCDPSELAFADGVLRHRGLAIDLVYNRLTDFYLDDPRHAALRQAYLADQVVLTRARRPMPCMPTSATWWC